MHLANMLLVFVVCVARIYALEVIAKYGDCSFSLDAASELSSSGTCSEQAGALYLWSSNIKSLAPDVFANMTEMKCVYCVGE